jgi:hypothetical protein
MTPSQVGASRTLCSAFLQLASDFRAGVLIWTIFHLWPFSNHFCYQRDHAHIKQLSDRLINKINLEVDHVVRNGDVEGYPGCVNLSFSYVEGESLLMALKVCGYICSIRRWLLTLILGYCTFIWQCLHVSVAGTFICVTCTWCCRRHGAFISSIWNWALHYWGWGRFCGWPHYQDSAQTPWNEVGQSSIFLPLILMTFQSSMGDGSRGHWYQLHWLVSVSALINHFLFD